MQSGKEQKGFGLKSNEMWLLNNPTLKRGVKASKIKKGFSPQLNMTALGSVGVVEEGDELMNKLHNLKQFKHKRQELRNEATDAEKFLWYELRKSRLCGKEPREIKV